MSRVAAGAAGLALACGLLAGCGAGSDGATGRPLAGTTGGAESAVHTDDSPHSIRVGLVEWSLELSRTTVRPGRLRLRVTNAGGTEHDLRVHGRRGSWHLPGLDPGQVAVLNVRTSPGERLHLSSAEPGQVHPMQAIVRVAAR